MRGAPFSLPWEPIARMLAQSDVAWREVAGHIAERYGLRADSVERQVWRMRETGRVSELWADRWAVGLGCHPVQLWGAAYYAKEAA